MQRSVTTVFLTRAFYINNVLLFSCPSPPELNNRHSERKWCQSPVDRGTLCWRKQYAGAASAACHGDSRSSGWFCKGEHDFIMALSAVASYTYSMYPSTKTNVNSKDKENRKESLGIRVCSADGYNCLDYTMKPDSHSEVFQGSSFWGEEFWVYRWLWGKKGVYQLHHAETWLAGHLDHAHGML